MDHDPAQVGLRDEDRRVHEQRRLVVRLKGAALAEREQPGQHGRLTHFREAARGDARQVAAHQALAVERLTELIARTGVTLGGDAVAHAERQLEDPHRTRVIAHHVVDRRHAGGIQRPWPGPQLEGHQRRHHREQRTPCARVALPEVDQGQREEHTDSQGGHDREAWRHAGHAEDRRVAQQRPRAGHECVEAGHVHEGSEGQPGEDHREGDPALRAQARAPPRDADDRQRDETHARGVLDEHRRRRELGLAEEPHHDRMRRIGCDEGQQVDPARAAAPVDRRRHPGAVEDLQRRAIEHGREHDGARECAGHDHAQRPRRGQVERGHDRPQVDEHPRHDQHGHDQDRGVQTTHADRQPEQRDATATTERQADDQRNGQHDHQVEQPRAHTVLPGGPPVETHHARHGVDGCDQHAIDRVVGIAEGGPGHRQAGQHGITQTFGAVDAMQAPQEGRERGGGHEAEVSGGPGHEHGPPGKHGTRQPRLDRGALRHSAGEHEGHPGGEHDRDQIDHVERRHRPEAAHEGQGERVEEDRVVVLREIDGPEREREDVPGGERIAMFHEGAVLEHPLIPDVHTGIAAGVTGQVRGDVRQQRPGEGHGDADITQHGGEVGVPRASCH